MICNETLKQYVLFQIVETLLLHGGHIDSRNRNGQRPVDLLRLVPECKINPLQFMTLKCLAARVVVDNKIVFKSQVPAILENFIQAH